MPNSTLWAQWLVWRMMTTTQIQHMGHLNDAFAVSVYSGFIWGKA